MNYIKLFEAYNSNVISSVFKFLKNKKIDSRKFLKDFKNLIERLDIPIGQIKDSDLEYLSSKKAIKISKPKNTAYVDCIKFWFTIDKGYIGYTGIGDKYYQFDTKEGDKFTIDEVEYLSKSRPKGKLIPIGIKDIKAGDILALFFSSSRDKSTLGFGEAYISENNKVYVFQDINDGSGPSYDDNIFDNSYNGYKYSWTISSNYGERLSDNIAIHKWEESDEDLHTSYETEESPFSFNLPFNSRFELSSWQNADHSISSYNDIVNSDFCIVLNLEEGLPNSVKNSVSEIRYKRRKDIENASFLKSNDKIKDENIGRYFNKIVSGMFNADNENIKNINRFVLSWFCSKYMIFSLISEEGGSIVEIKHFFNEITELRGYPNKDDKIRQISNRYKRNKLRYTDISNKIKNNIASVKYQASNYSDESGRYYKRSGEEYKYTMEIIDGVTNVGDIIYNYLISVDLETLDDFNSLYYIMDSIKNYIKDIPFHSSGIRRILSSIESKSDLFYYIESYGDRGMESDLKLIKNLERYVNRILR